MKIRLSNYVEKVEAKYINARKEWEKVRDQLQREEDRYNKVEWSYLTPEGKTAENNKHEKIKSELIKQFAVIRENFQKDFDEVERASDKIFDRGYKHTPELVDQNGLSIINNSNLEVNEIIDLAESYRTKGNMTMYFLIAEKLKGEEGDKAKGYYLESRHRRENREDHETLENFGYVCLSALRDNPLLSDGIHNIHEELYQKSRAQGEEIAVDCDSVFEV